MKFRWLIRNTTSFIVTHLRNNQFLSKVFSLCMSLGVWGRYGFRLAAVFFLLSPLFHSIFISAEKLLQMHSDGVSHQRKHKCMWLFFSRSPSISLFVCPNCESWLKICAIMWISKSVQCLCCVFVRPFFLSSVFVHTKSLVPAIVCTKLNALITSKTCKSSLIQ